MNFVSRDEVNSVSLLESRLSVRGRISVNVLGDGNCFFLCSFMPASKKREGHVKKVGLQSRGDGP